MIYIVTIFMVTMQGGSYFPNITNKVKKKSLDLVFRSHFFITIHCNYGGNLCILISYKHNSYHYMLLSQSRVTSLKSACYFNML